MSEFIGGVHLSQLFHEELIEPLLRGTFPGVPYAAALLGPGSEVLGYDTALSADHDWGPRLFLFLTEPDHAAHAARIDVSLQGVLPRIFHDYPTRFRRSRESPSAPAKHRIEIHTVCGFFTACLGFDPTGEWRPADWLVTPEQTLLELTAGAVYHDGTGELTGLRARLAYYPHDLWLYLMAAQWRRVAQQEAFMGRAGDVGDELGSLLIAASIVHDLMRLCFFIERRYAPYSKWFGTAFARLPRGPLLGPLFARTLQADQWREREAWLAESYAAVVTLHNQLGLTPPVETAVSSYYDRPYLVIHADRIADALRAEIKDPAARALPWCGAVDQLSDSTDFLSPVEIRARARPLYEGKEGATCSPTVSTTMPVSSKSSRRPASANVSPSSSAPPGVAQ